MAKVLLLHAAPSGRRGSTLERGLLPRLPYARRLELESADPAARQASLLGIDLLLDGIERLGLAPLDPLRIVFPTGGKPFVAGGPWFSISHCPIRVAVAISGDVEIGLDLEAVQRPAAQLAADRYGLDRWTATEAVLKALGEDLRSLGGVDLAADLGSAHFGGETLQLQMLDLGAGLVACLASRSAVAVEIVEAVATCAD